MNKITVLGSLNVDLTISTPRIPEMGETIRGTGFGIFPGGKGANQAVAAAKLGGKVSMVGCLGDDPFGETLLSSLEGNGVDTSLVKRLPGVSTGVAMIVRRSGDNFIILDAGANEHFTAAHVEAAQERIAASDVLMLQLEIPLPAVERAVKTAKRHGVVIMLNPAPCCPLSEEMLQTVDYLTPNQSECEQLTGMPVKCVEDARKALERLLEKGVRRPVITLGGDGAVYFDGRATIYCPVPKVRVVDTTAAGDSFCAALAVAVSNGETMDAAVDFANKVACITVTRAGAQTSLPFLCEVENGI